MIHVAIAGAAGRMGRNLLDACQQTENLQCTVALEHPDNPLLGTDAGEVAGIGRLNMPIVTDLAAWLDQFETLIDFTPPGGDFGAFNAVPQCG
jgi:4-hydroxy-tetrahydrodipicolinate reductase